MTVLVTGGAGFIGSHVVDRLSAHGYEPRIYDLVRSPYANGDVEWVVGDLLDRGALDRAMSGCEAVIHLAAVADVNAVAADPLRAELVNVRGTRFALEAAGSNGVRRFLYASTVWVYGGADGNGYLLDEGTPLVIPNHFYTATKLAGEMYCRSYAELYELGQMTLRFGIPYGPRSRAAAVAASGSPGASSGPKKNKSEVIHLKLTPSSAQLAACMPDARLNVAVALTADKRGFDVFRIRARHLPPNTSFTVFLLEQAGAPFGAAEYIGDFTTNAHGNAHNTYRLIVQEAFSSTLVNGVRQRVDLNRIGSWFADPNDDNFCLGPNSPPTPFDGDGQAGVQAFNSANADPLPAP